MRFNHHETGKNTVYIHTADYSGPVAHHTCFYDYREQKCKVSEEH